jgi:hypothetical protein
MPPRRQSEEAIAEIVDDIFLPLAHRAGEARTAGTPALRAAIVIDGS